MSHGTDSRLRTHKVYLDEILVVAPTDASPVARIVAAVSKKKKKKEK